jgi:hypothetical protein
MFKSKYKFTMTENILDLYMVGLLCIFIGVDTLIDVLIAPLILGTYCDCNTLKVILYAVIACLGITCMGIVYKRMKKEKI